MFINKNVIILHPADKAHCIQELAQCGAVILRMMEFVQKEIDGGKK